MGWIDGTRSRGKARDASARLQMAKYAHMTHARCRCGNVMRAVGTIHEGQIKRWRCDACERQAQTSGTDIPVI